MSKHLKEYYLFNTTDAAKLIGVNRRTIARWRNKGQIEPFDPLNPYLYSIDEINRIRLEKYSLPPLNRVQLESFKNTKTYLEFPNPALEEREISVIGFSGPKNVGKTTTAKKVAKEFKKLGKPAEPMSLATPVYQIASIITGLPVSLLQDENYKERRWTEETAPLPCLVGMRPRDLLQKIGTECFRDNIHQDIWIQHLLKRAQQLKTEIAIVDDIRFTNEVKACNIVIELTREGISYTKEHKSENGVQADIQTRLYPQINYTHLAQKILRAVDRVRRIFG